MTKFDLKNIKGLIPALVTPFDKSERFDAHRMRICVDFLIESGVNGLYVNGTMGEAFLMSKQERKRVLEVVLKQTAGRIPVIAHVSAIGTSLSIELA